MVDQPNIDASDVNNQESSHPEFVAGALFGALAGGVAALLLTPKNGQEMRGLVLDYLKDWEQEAESFAVDAQEMAVAFKKALDEGVDQAEVHHPQAAAEVRRQAEVVADVAKRSYDVAEDSVSQVVESVRTGWDDRREAEEPKPYHPSVELPIDPDQIGAKAWVKMGSAQAYRGGGSVVDEDVVDDSVAPAPDLSSTASLPEDIPADPDLIGADVDFEEPAFARANPHSDANFLARREVIDEEVEVVKEPKEAFKHPDWQASTTGRRTTSSQSFDMHGSSWDSPEPEVAAPQSSLSSSYRDRVEVAEVQPMTASDEVEPETSSHLDADAPAQELTSKRKPAPKRDKDGLKPLYVRTVVESRDPIEPLIQPITSDARLEPVSSKKFFRK